MAARRPAARRIARRNRRHANDLVLGAHPARRELGLGGSLLRLDARAVVTVDDGGTTRVDRWTDLSGGDDAVEIAGVTRPVYDPDGGPSTDRPAVVFAGAESLDAGSTPRIPATADWSAYILHATTPLTADCLWISQYLQAAPPTGSGRWFAGYLDAALNAHGAAFGSTATLATQNVTIGHDSTAWAISAVIRDTGAGTIRTRVNLAEASTSDNGNEVLQTGVVIGARTTSATVYNDSAQTQQYCGRIALIELFDNAHDTETADNFTRWIARRHGLAL